MSLIQNPLAEKALRQALRPKLVLVIDDFQGMRSLMQGIMSGLGVREVDTAPSAEEALERLRWKNYDIILCDYNLVPGRNGQHLLEEARTRQLIRTTTIWLMVTAEKTLDMVLGAIEHTPDDYLIKPIHDALLRERLEKALARKKVMAPIQRAMQDRQFAAALALCDHSIEKRFHLAEILRLKSTIYLQMEDYAGARQLFEKILAVRNLPWARTGLGRVLTLTGEPGQAASLLREVIAENPAYIEAYDRLAEACQAQELLDEAQEVLLRAVALSPSSIARQKALGAIASARKDYPVAETAFKTAIQHGRHSICNAPDAYIGLAALYQAAGDRHQARETLSAAQAAFTEKRHLEALAAAAVQLQLN